MGHSFPAYTQVRTSKMKSAKIQDFISRFSPLHYIYPFTAVMLKERAGSGVKGRYIPVEVALVVAGGRD